MAFSLQNLALVMHELKTFEAVKKKTSKLAISVKNLKKNHFWSENRHGI